MAPKKKKGGADNAEKEDAINKQYSTFKLNYKQSCEQLKLEPVTPIERVPCIERIQNFNINGCNIGPKGCEAIVCAVKAMDEKGAEPHGPDKVTFPASQMLHIQQLTIYKCDIQDEGAYHISEILRNKFLIEECALAENDIGWPGANDIGLALKANFVLKKLNLNCNPLGDEGIAALADGLRWNGYLETLHVQYCGIGCYGAGALAQDVIGNDYCRLTDLSLKGNELEPEGVASIADSLKQNITITSLNLADCGMGNDPISRDAMREALVRHPTLVSLDLNLNAIGAEGGQMLLEVLSLNTNIINCGVFERLGLMYRDIQDKVAENGSKKKKGKKKKKK